YRTEPRRLLASTHRRRNARVAHRDRGGRRPRRHTARRRNTSFQGGCVPPECGAAWRPAVTRRASGPSHLRCAVVLATFAFAIVGLSYLPYGVFAEWSYLRFLLPAFPLLFVAIGGLLTGALLRPPTPIRASLLLCTLAAVGAFNVLHAEHEQAFNMRRYESRYRQAGRYLASALPPKAVIVAVQESGSARYYTSRPVLRWDWLEVDLDTAIAALRARGWHPVFAIEDWERPDLMRKHPASANARLDWQPRAEFGDEPRVFLYDPLD